MRIPLLAELLLMFAFVCFAFAAWQSSSPLWNRIVAVGFAVLTLSFLLR